MFRFFKNKARPAKKRASSGLSAAAGVGRDFAASTQASGPHSIEASDSVPAAAPDAGSGIAYYPHLIKELVADHRKLDQLQEQMRTAFEQGRHDLVSALLDEYGSTLRSHLLKENMRLYVYLRQQLVDDEVSDKLVRDFRKEMDGIAREGLDFLDRYSDIGTLNVQARQDFIQELNQIGSIVHERMRREERDLYPLYAKSYR